jgi:hypothetical protein
VEELMAHVPLVPIGNPRETVVDQAEFDRELAGHAPLAAKLQDRRHEVQAGWGNKYAQRVHEKDKLTTRERLERLKDEGTDLFEVGTFVNYGVDFKGLRSPAAGVVTAFAKVKGRWTTRLLPARGGRRRPRRSNARKRWRAGSASPRFTSSIAAASTFLNRARASRGPQARDTSSR